MKKLCFLLLILLLAAIPKSLLAYTDGQIVPFSGNYYRVVSAAQNTLSFLGTDDSNSGKLIIPEKILDGKGTTFTVVGVDYSPVYKCKNITSVKLPESIVYLGYDIFQGANLESINIPKNVTSISENVWIALQKVPKQTVDPANLYFSSDADGALYSKDKSVLRSIPSDVPLVGGTYTVNNQVTSITNTCFRLVNDLTKVILPPNLQQISTGYPTIAPTNTIEAFEMPTGGTTPFTTVDGVLFKDNELVLYPRAKDTENYKVPNGIKSIASYAISNSWKMKTIDLNGVTKLSISSIFAANLLTSITLPKDIKKYDPITKEGMSEGCFEACVNVTKYDVPIENTDFLDIDGVVYSKPNKDILYFYPPNKAGQTYDIPASVKTIARRAFQSAQNITSLAIPAGVEQINMEACRSMTNLESLVFEEPSKIQDIGSDAFRACSKLKNVTLPSTLTSLKNIFYQCSKLETINIPNGSKLKTIENSAFVTNTDLKNFNFLGSCELQSIGGNAFANLQKLVTFKFPKSVTDIRTNAFSGCSSMATIDFDPDADILKIGSGAFADCGLTSFNVPKKVQEIDREAFRNCNVLTTINVTEATTKISPEAFKYCSNLKAINVSKKNTVYSSVDGYLLSQDKKTLVIFPPGKANEHFTLLPPSITTIGKYAFYDCKKLKNVTIPNLVTSIGERAFGLCSNLNTITFLCDNKINPADIEQQTSKKAFDDGTEAPDMFGKINIQVRKEKLSDYNSDAFYQKFHSISPSFEVGKEEYIAVSDGAVDMLSTTREDETFVLPTEISYNSKTYKVSLIGDYAFQHVTNKVKEVVVKKDVEYIGARAFMTDINAKTSTIKSVFFIESNPTKEMLSTTRFNLDETNTNYNEFAPTTTIYVKKSALPVYKTAWAKKVYKIATGTEEKSPFDFTSQLEYKIKDVKITHRYGTFAREFDTDFSDYYTQNHCSAVAAFVSSTKINPGTGDYGTTTHHVQMTSVDKKGGYAGSYSYVPASTGVLLKVLDKDTTDPDFYYTIGEQDNQTYHVQDNIMTGVTINPETSVAATSTAPVYLMQGGIFRKAESNIAPFPIHKAYVKFNSLPAGARVVFEFDDGMTTGIESLEAEPQNRTDTPYYNLQGQRISQPQQPGLYIHNGRKVIIK